MWVRAVVVHGLRVVVMLVMLVMVPVTVIMISSLWALSGPEEAVREV